MYLCHEYQMICKIFILVMNRRFVIVTLSSLLTFALLACSSDMNDVNTNEAKDNLVQADTTHVALMSFFSKTLPVDTRSECFFTDVEDNKDTCTIINCQDEFRLVYKGNEPLPPIDFSNHSLIIGKLYATAGVYVKSQSLELSNTQACLSLNLEYSSDAALSVMLNCYYWGLYEKISNTHITVKKYYHGTEWD